MAYRFEQRLSRVTEYEREAKNDCSQRYERRQSVRAVKDQQTHEDNADKGDGYEDGVEFGYDGANVLQTM